jgi:O-antigen/teichoic acid export membrane protein
MGRVGRHTLVYGAGMMLTRAVSFIMLPVYTRFLTPADYGVMELIGMTLDIISIVAGAKLALGIFRYYHKAEGERERNAVVSTALVALGSSYGVIGAITYVIAKPLSLLVFTSPQYAPLIQLAAITLALQSLQLVPLSYARLRERSGLFVIANALKLAMQLGFNIYFVVYHGMGVRGVFLGNLAASAIVGAWLCAYVVRDVGLRLSPVATRQLLRYGVPLIGTQFATFIVTFGDRYFLQRAGTMGDVGLYSLAYQFGFLLAAIGYIPFEMVWEPMRFEIAKRGDRDDVFARGFLYMNLVLLTTAVGLSLFVPDVLRIMTTPAFYSAADLVPVILIAYVLQGWAQIQDIGILMSEKTVYSTLANWAAALVALAAYALLIPRYHGMGAAVATAIAFATRYGWIYFFSQRLWRVEYNWSPVVRLCAVSVVVCIAGALLPRASLVTSLGLRMGLLAVYFFAVWHASVLSNDDRLLVRRWILSPRLALTMLRA